jgi:hypothetical protein
MFVNELFENSGDMFAMPWRTKVASLLVKLLESPARQRSVEIEPNDIDDIRSLIEALQRNNINRAKELWDRFSYNELDNALYLYIHRLRPEIDLFELLGDEDDINEDDEDTDMFAPAKGNKYDAANVCRQFSRSLRRQAELEHGHVEQDLLDYRIAAADFVDEIADTFEKNGLYAGADVFRKFAQAENGTYEYIASDLYHDLKTEKVDIEKLNLNEEDDEMFASPFRVERDVMMWQRTASRIAGTRGMHSRKFGNDIVFWVQEKDGPVTGVYYSPQPASDDTNIGTWNKRFRGDLEQYMAQDPHNPFKQLREEDDDDMFSAEPRYYQKLGISIENYGEGYLEMGRDVQYSQDEAVHEYAGDLIRNGKAMLRAGESFKRGMQQGLADWVLVDREVREDYYTYCREVENWDPEKIIDDFVGLREDAAGVGVVKNSKDPRYVMATMGDQNDVTAETLPKMMKAYSLVGKKAKK